MKTIILILSLFIAGLTVGYAQCDKKILFTSSKTEHLDDKGQLTRSDDEKAVVIIDNSDIHITINDDHKLTGIIKSKDCNWTVPFKEGKSVLKAVISGDDGQDRNVTITIQNKDGKIILLFDAEGEEDHVRVTADKFEEAA